MANVIRALASGPSRGKLLKLNAGGTGMGEEAGHALLEALREGAWPKLEKLSCNRNGLGDGIVGEGLAEVVEGGVGSWLKSLDVQWCDMTEAGGERLCLALRRGALPRLEHLMVHKRLGVDWRSAVADRAKPVEISRY